MTTVTLRGEVILFQSGVGKTKIQVRFEDHTVWLKSRPEATIRKFRIVQREASRSVDRLVDHLLARIRDIRSSKKAYWRKGLDIFATSVNYDPVINSESQVEKDFDAAISHVNKLPKNRKGDK
ncbi:RhuM family protein [Bdellovibrionota bacterium FG-2]